MNFVGDALTFVHQLLNSFTLFKQALTVVYQLKDQLTITVKLGIPWTPEICESPRCFYVTTYSIRDQDMQEKHKTPIKIRLLPKIRTSGVWLVHFPQHKNLSEIFLSCMFFTTWPRYWSTLNQCNVRIVLCTLYLYVEIYSDFEVFRILKIKIRKITSEDKFFAESSLETYGKNQH